MERKLFSILLDVEESLWMYDIVVVLRHEHRRHPLYEELAAAEAQRPSEERPLLRPLDGLLLHDEGHVEVVGGVALGLRPKVPDDPLDLERLDLGALAVLELPAPGDAGVAHGVGVLLERGGALGALGAVLAVEDFAKDRERRDGAGHGSPFGYR